jgi:uncharacterized membrane protein HdeD (DUF308 family)
MDSRPDVSGPASFNAWRVARQRWGWFIALGLVSLLLGIIAILDSFVATIASMFVFGWLLLIAGVVEAVHVFRDRKGGHLFLNSLNAVLSFVVGLILLEYPVPGAMMLTVLLTVFFIVTGAFRIVSALSLRFPHWGWALVNGVITLLLGIMVWAHWPSSALWVIGLFIGINLILAGWAQVMHGSGVRRLSS